MSSIVFIVVGVLGLVGAGTYWRRVARWLKKAEATTAEIVRLESSGPGQGNLPENTNPRVNVFPVVRFTDREAVLWEHRAAMGAPYGRLKDKKEIDVVYDPQNPEDVRLGKGADRGFAVMLAFFSLLSIGMGVYGVWYSGDTL